MRILYVAALALAFSHGAQGQTVTLTTLHEFSGEDGSLPTSALLQTPDGSLYGVTLNGGARNDGGTVFRLTPDGSFSTVHSFEGGATIAEGNHPYGILTLANDGLIYGAATRGGAGNCSDGTTIGCGAVFSIAPDGTVDIVYLFSGDPDGSQPSGVIQAQDGNFYGIAFVGLHSPGNAYRLGADGSHSILHAFDLGRGPSLGANLIQATDGNLYGTTRSGGGSDLGTLFRLTPDGDFTGLHSFSDFDEDGNGPRAALVEASDGFLYGTTQTGGGPLGYGTVFRIRPSGDGYEVLHRFAGGADGAYPAAAMAEGSDGNLYGTTDAGGTSFDDDDCPSGCGTIFRILEDGTFQSIHSFGPATSGSSPKALIRGQDGKLYGTTAGGQFEAGTIFRLEVSSSPPPPPPPPNPDGGGGGGAVDLLLLAAMVAVDVARRVRRRPALTVAAGRR